jgi:hypothetical protein
MWLTCLKQAPAQPIVRALVNAATAEQGTEAGTAHYAVILARTSVPRVLTTGAGVLRDATDGLYRLRREHLAPSLATAGAAPDATAHPSGDEDVRVPLVDAETTGAPTAVVGSAMGPAQALGGIALGKGLRELQLQRADVVGHFTGGRIAHALGLPDQCLAELLGGFNGGLLLFRRAFRRFGAGGEEQRKDEDREQIAVQGHGLRLGCSESTTHSLGTTCTIGAQSVDHSTPKPASSRSSQ